MTDAREKSAKILDDYAKTLDKAYEEHTEDARKRAKMQEEAETEKLGRERNKKLSIGQLDLRREVSRRQEELKDKLVVMRLWSYTWIPLMRTRPADWPCTTM